MSLLDAPLHCLVRSCPRWVMKRIAWRYIAGEDRTELLGLVDALHRGGLLTTVDVLGENAGSMQAVREAVAEYLSLLDALASRSRSSQVSVKLSLLGLRLSEAQALASLLEILGRAEALGIGVCIDMEDSSTTDATLRCFRRARERFEQVGIAIQACLRRSLADVESLFSLRPAIRICKGIYREPLALAYHGREEIRRSYLELLGKVLDGGGYPAVATHDPYLVQGALEQVRSRGLSSDGHEFQMLLGVGQRLRPAIRAAGSRLRLYCPYGTNWYAYCLRRLQENPAMLRHVMNSLLTFNGAAERRAYSS